MTETEFERVRHLHGLLNLDNLLSLNDFGKLVSQEEYADYQGIAQSRLRMKAKEQFAYMLARLEGNEEEEIVNSPVEEPHGYNTRLFYLYDECSIVDIYRTRENGQWIYRKESSSVDNQRPKITKRKTFAGLLATLENVSWESFTINDLHPSFAFPLVTALIDKLNQIGKTSRSLPDNYTQYEVKLNILFRYSPSLGWYYEPNMTKVSLDNHQPI